MRSGFMLWFLPRAYRWVMNLLMLTCRIETIGRARVEQLQACGQSWIFSAWHENTAMSVWTERNTGMAMLASDSRDGEYIARGIELVGNWPVRGSASKGGAKAIKAMIQVLKSGRCAAITPDGPRGPKRKLQSGVLYISALSGSPILPYHVVASREWTLKTWDRHRLPKPFSRVLIRVGTPCWIKRDELQQNEAHVVQLIEEAMESNRLAAEAAINVLRDQSPA